MLGRDGRVARVVRDAVTARFRASLAACGIAAGGPTARAVGRAIAALSEASEALAQKPVPAAGGTGRAFMTTRS
jgi:hypothetical protein